MNRLKTALKKWLGVSALEGTANLHQHRLDVQRDKIDDRIAELDKLTACDVDVGYRGPCTMILTGVYRGKGYVKFVEMDHDEFRRWVEITRLEERDGLMRNVDAPYCSGPFSFEF